MTSEGGAVERLICSSENRMPGHNTVMRLGAGARAGRGGPPSGTVSRRAFPHQTPLRVRAPFGGARHLPVDIEREGDQSRHAIECHAGASTNKSSIAQVARFRPRRGIEAAVPLLHQGSDVVMWRLHVAGNRKRIERVNGPRTFEQVPIFIAGKIVEPADRLDLE